MARPVDGEIGAFLDRRLGVAGFADASNNGLQVASESPVRRVACGVDASMEFFEAALARGANFLVCHHGLSWGDSLKRIVGIPRRRLSFLLKHGMALYACHLPLDAHPVYGNNVLLCRALGLRSLRSFGLYEGREIGFAGSFPRAVSRDRFVDLVRRNVNPDVRVMAFGPSRIRSVAVVSGGGADELDEAGEKGFDAFLTGEPRLHAYALAREHGINAVFAGHYATEVFGVRALAGLVKQRFGIPAEFIDLQTPY